MSIEVQVRAEKWGRARTFIRATMGVAISAVVAYCYVLIGAPWSSWPSLGGYAFSLAWPVAVIIFSENMIPREVVTTPDGVEFRYLFITRFLW